MIFVNPPKTAVVRFGLAATLAPIFAFAQTQLVPEQLKGTPSATGLVFVVLTNGEVISATIEGLELIDRGNGTPIVLRVIPPLPLGIVEKTAVLRVTSLTTTWTFTTEDSPILSSIHVFANGASLTEGIDYTLSADGKQITFTGTRPRAGFLLKVRYRV